MTCMKQVFCMLVLLGLLAVPAHARGNTPSLMPPLFQELKEEGAKVSWRGRTGCCDSWVLTNAKQDQVMWVATDRSLSGIKYQDMDGGELTIEAIRKRLEMVKK